MSTSNCSTAYSSRLLETPSTSRPPNLAPQDACIDFEDGNPSDDLDGSLEPGSGRDIFNFTRRRHVPILLFAVFSTTITAALKTVNYVFVGLLFEAVTEYGRGSFGGDKALAEVVKWCLVLCALAAGNVLSSMALLLGWTVFGTVQAKEIRTRMFRALLGKEMDWYDTRQDGISSMLIRMRTQTREFQTMVTYSFGYAISDILTIIFSIVLGLVFSWKLTLLMLSTVPVSAVALNLITRNLNAAVESQKACLTEASKHTSSSLAAVDIVKVYNGFDHEVWQYLTSILKAAKHYRTQARCNSGQKAYVKFWIIGIFAGGFTFGIYLVNHGARAGNILTAFYATLTALTAIEGILASYLVLCKGMSASRWLKRTMDDTTQGGRKPRHFAGTAWPQDCPGGIEFRDVAFAYPSNPTKTILHPSSISFSFPPGELAFIVGRSGSGKSTIGNLLVQFYQPRSGKIMIDGTPMSNIDVRWIRSNITLVQQSSVLFNDTFFANVALGHPNPSKVAKGEVQDACESALLHTTISALPAGLETQLGSGGATLSGGQMQRLALARARLRDPPILILDEVTSGLDQASGSLVMEAIRFWRHGKTTIIITHDVSHIAECDLVYVIDQGRVVQTGSRSELELKETGPFAQFVQSYSGKCQLVKSRTPEKKKDRGEFVPVKSVPSRKPDPLATSMLPMDHMFSRRRSRRTSFGVGRDYEALVRSTWQQQQGQPRIQQFMVKENKLEHVAPVISEKITTIHPAEERTLPASPETQRRIELEFLKNSGENVQRHRKYSRPLRRRSTLTTTTTSSTKESILKSPTTPTRILMLAPSQEKQTNKRTRAEHQAEQEPPLQEIFKSVWQSLGASQKFKLLVALLPTFVVGVSTPAFSFLLARLLTVFSLPTGMQTEEAKRWTSYLALVVAIEAVATYYSNYLFESVAQWWVDNLRVESLKRILAQPKEWHGRAQNSSEMLSSILDRNGEEMRNLLGRSANSILAAIMMGIVAISWAMTASWKLTLVTISAGPVVLVFSQLYVAIGTKHETRCDQTDIGTASILSEMITNIRVVRTLTLERYFAKKYTESSRQSYENGMKLAFYSSPLFGVSESTPTFLTALVFYYGMVLLTQGEFDLVDIMQATHLLIFSIGSASILLQDVPQISAAWAAAGQILRLSKLPLRGGFEHNGTIRIQTPLPVRMRDVRFFYPNHPEINVLRGINMVLKPNETVAMVGSSGCGKSTIANLLLRLHAPSTMGPQSLATPFWQKPSMRLSRPSPLTYAGVPAEEVDTAHLRTMISYVPQHPHLFSLTLAENIAYGLPDGSQLRDIDNITHVARRAGIHQLALSLPQGYNTKVGEGGVSLSGGQTQMVAIARALLRLSDTRSGLIIMDEPTASLDAQGAQEVRETLRSLVEDNRVNAKRVVTSPGGCCFEEDEEEEQGPENGVALVLITHSPEMMKMADRLLVMDHGVVVEEGEYHEVLSRGKSALGKIVGEADLEPALQGELTSFVGINRDGVDGVDAADRVSRRVQTQETHDRRKSPSAAGGSTIQLEGTRGYVPGMGRPD